MFSRYDNERIDPLPSGTTPEGVVCVCVCVCVSLAYRVTRFGKRNRLKSIRPIMEDLADRWRRCSHVTSARAICFSGERQIGRPALPSVNAATPPNHATSGKYPSIASHTFLLVFVLLSCCTPHITLHTPFHKKRTSTPSISNVMKQVR